ncbi:hypothetical protein ArV2_gp59 [Arthrobacter phage vB_ArS-ArV2]|uniref:Uncharacterized protein n=1 Tax=Arthrobacter phage vB_ArS-ArV2 TaxID=1414742 RepID=V5RBF8_9CAUD|nr:hypothetical protein ArV2_gp59 [Arthrobacter phage vB_ArS-ArV2]AHB31669.1 hypothetical protein ArV2_gp59 [Arthrobacter phage vB_ArS-ArV2]
MADKRAFAKFDVGYLDNPKMLDILDTSSSAILMHFASVLYCAQHLTDGIVASKAMQRKAGGSEADVHILLSAGLWHEPGHTCTSCPQPPVGKVYVHDFLEHNREAAEAKRVSERRSEAAKSRWAKEKEPMQDALQTDADCNAERERKREIKKTPSSKPSVSTDFDTFWAQYPRKAGKIAGRKAFEKAMKLTTLEQLLQGVELLKRETAGKELTFIPHPATWLNDGRWDDEPTTSSKPTAASPWSKDFYK